MTPSGDAGPATEYNFGGTICHCKIEVDKHKIIRMNNGLIQYHYSDLPSLLLAWNIIGRRVLVEKIGHF